MTRLILFTNDYPHDRGDAVFVEKEIDALAAAFDTIVVFSASSSDTGPFRQLPANATFGGNLYGRAPGEFRWLLRPRALVAVARALWMELRNGRGRHLGDFARAAVLGLGRAYRPAVRAAIAADAETVAYGFWGMGGGLVLPWTEDVRARVVRVHGYDLYEERSPSGYLPLRPFLFARVDRILAISTDGARYLAERYRRLGAASKTIVSRLGVYGPAESERPAPQPERTIVSCSAISDVKRVELILAAVQELAALDSSVPLRWVHFGDGPRMAELTAVVEGVSGLSVELRGSVSNDEVLDFYRSARVDLFVNASISEGVPVSIMEAIAHSIPVVATAVGGTPEIIGPELGTGELVPADATPAEFAERMRDVIEGVEQFDPRRLWSTDYDAHRTGESAAQLIRSLLDDGPPTGLPSTQRSGDRGR
ncbi:glycosyltransferase [Microbacterium murale]|uniref:D-inositol 3-phosphate glycosyltransferase n=1 Tax=Microbacterium murale TaxID=1081040 RepID=A0ABU0PDN2_9MICO|nr:glycosyltransferase [Microbacterium murale]MDQ0645037.1 colanic acid/amylovoran biosynthesis glycosyltransferase [Microbacterium murale]